MSVSHVGEADHVKTLLQDRENSFAMRVIEVSVIKPAYSLI